MVFKCGPSKLIQSFNINPSTEIAEITTELKIHIQMIGIDFNGSKGLCFRKSFVIF